MSYRKTFFGKIIEDDSSKKDDGRNEYIEQKSRSLHFWSGICAMIDVGLFLKEFFGIRIQFDSVILRIVFFVFVPFLFGCLKILVIDTFFDRISPKIKWIFAFLAFGIFVLFALRFFLRG